MKQLEATIRIKFNWMRNTALWNLYHVIHTAFIFSNCSVSGRPNTAEPLFTPAGQWTLQGWGCNVLDREERWFDPAVKQDIYLKREKSSLNWGRDPSYSSVIASRIYLDPDWGWKVVRRIFCKFKKLKVIVPQEWGLKSFKKYNKL